MKIFKLFIAVLFFISLFSCEKENISEYSDINQEIVFQFEYTNYAWGKNHRGFFVLNDGSIYKYDNPEGWISQEHNLISVTDFNNNLSKATEKIGTVNANKMIEMKSLISKFDKERLTEMKSVMADAGAERYSFYLKNGSKEEYRNYLLLIRGDIFQKNPDKDAEQLADWLIQLNDGGIFNEDFFD